jgi:hypothetical protein
MDIKGWLGQSTTGAGFAALLGVAGAVASGQMTWQQAVPVAVGALVALVWPEDTGVAKGANTLASDLIAFVPLITAAVEHGKSAASPATQPAQVQS